jgi:hypothetical protein
MSLRWSVLKELGAFVEALQRELELQGRKSTDIQVEVKCKTIIEWTVLDQAVEREIRADIPSLEEAIPIRPSDLAPHAHL